MDEISVVTRPANQHSNIVLFKSDEGPMVAMDVYGEPEPVAMTVDEAARCIQRGWGRLSKEKWEEYDDDELDAEEVKDAIRQARWWSEVAYDDLVASPSAVSKSNDDDGWHEEDFMDAGLNIELGITDEVEQRAERMVRKSDQPMTREQAIAKVFNDSPDLRKAYRLAQTFKSKGAAVPSSSTVAKGEAAYDDRRDYAAMKHEDQQAAMSVLREQAQEMVDFGQAATVEQGIVQLCREQPELWRAWKESFREAQ